MAKGGALKPVYVVTDEELEINGGEFVLQQGPALKVRGFTLDNYAGRKVQGGAAQPVYVVPEASAPSLHGGHWRVIAGQPIKVLSVTEAERNIIQGPAIPVYPVDDVGAYDPDFAGAPYYQKVLSYGPIAYWPLWETEGFVAQCLVNPLQNGTYNSNVSTWPVGVGIGDGNTAPTFDGTNDLVNVFSATFNAAFDGDEGSLVYWMKVLNAGVWIDGQIRKAVSFEKITAPDARIDTGKRNGNNTLRWLRDDSAGTQSRDDNTINLLTWMNFAMTWSLSNNRMIPYLNALISGVPIGGLNVFGAGLSNLYCCIGSQTTAGAFLWRGYIAHVSVFDYELSQPQIADLTVI